MAKPLFRVRVCGDRPAFQPLVAAGQSMLDRWNSTDKILARFLGRFVGQPEWHDDDVGFMARDEQDRLLDAVSCTVATEDDLRGPLKQELAELQDRLCKAQPASAREKSLQAALVSGPLFPQASAEFVGLRCQLFKYRDPQGKWRLVWCYGYEPTASRADARAVICPHANCAALQMRHKESGQQCAICGQPMKSRSGKRRLLQAALVLLLLLVAGGGAAVALLGIPVSLAGRVLQEDGQPIANAVVQIDGWPEKIQCDNSGVFRVSRIPWGTRRISAQATGFATSEQSVPLALFQENRLDIKLAGAGQVSGRVTHEFGGKQLSVEGASVSLAGASATAITDNQGQFRLEKIVPGSIALNVKADGFKDKTIDAKATTDGGQTLQVLLIGAGEITGKVVYDADPKVPVADAEVRAAEGLMVRTDAKGIFSLVDLPPGDLDLRFAAPGLKSESKKTQPGEWSLTVRLRGDAVLTGEVLRADNNAPVPNAEIRIAETPFKAIANESGVFRLKGVRSGPLRAIAQAPGLVGALEHTLTASDPSSVKILVAGSLTATGRVIDAQTKQPIADAAVSAGKGLSTAATDPMGRFTLAGLMAGKEKLTIRAPQYLPRNAEIELSSDRTNASDIELRKGTVLKGRVLAGKDEKPLPDIEVIARSEASGKPDDAKATTNEVGAFEFPPQVPGETSLTVSAPGYFPTTLKLDPKAGVETLDDIVLRELASVQGVVLAAHDRKPLAGVIVGVAETGERLKTGSDGSFAFAQLPAGELSFAAKADGYEPLRWKHAVQPGAQKLPEVLLVGNSLVRGIAFKDKDLQQTLGGVALEVTAGAFKKSLKSAADGSFEIGKLPPGEVTVKAALEGYQDAKLVKLVSPESLVIEVPLVPLVTGKVVVFDLADKSKRPLPDAEASVQLQGALQKAARHRDGSLELKGIVPGRVELHARSPGFAGTAVELEFVVGKPLEIGLKKLRPVQGLIVDASKPNIPINNATIGVAFGDVVETVTSDRGGRFTINLPAGSSELSAKASGYRESWKTVDVPAEGAASIKLQLDPFRNLRGSVVNAINNQPLPGTTLRLVGTDGKEQTVTSNDRGLFEFPIMPAAAKLLHASKEGFQSLQFQVVDDEMRIVLNPVVPRGQVRVVLTWAAQPADMDGHLFDADDIAGIQTNFSGKVKLPHEWWSGNARLDVDDQNSFGTETITILRPGKYQYYVADFASLGDRKPREQRAAGMRQSRSEVRVYYDGGDPNRAYTLPKTVLGPVWHVVDIVLDDEGNVTLTEPEDKWLKDLPTGPVPLDYVKPGSGVVDVAGTGTGIGTSGRPKGKPIVYKQRQWRDREGTPIADATLVQLRNEKVTLRKADGGVIEIALEKLSDIDNQYLEQVRPNGQR